MFQIAGQCYGIDDPIDGDAGPTLPICNQACYVTTIWDVTKAFRLGFQLSYLKTNYALLRDNEGSSSTPSYSGGSDQAKGPRHGRGPAEHLCFLSQTVSFCVTREHKAWGSDSRSGR